MCCAACRGATKLDIREYYGVEDDLKPGKKGIGLTMEQWNALLDHAETLQDEASKI